MPKSCLFILDDTTISFNYSGSSTRRKMDFLVLKENGYKIYVVRLLNKNKNKDILDFESESKTELSEIITNTVVWKDIYYELGVYRGSRAKKIYLSITNPEEYVYSGINKYSGMISELIERWNIDLVWSSSVLSACIVNNSKRNKWKWVNYIGDWKHKLTLIRGTSNSFKANLSKRYMSWIYKRIDLKCLRNCDFIETASSKQEKEIINYGMRNVISIAQFYDNPEIGEKWSSESDPFIVHLGSLKTTTSNRVGMAHYVNEIYPIVSTKIEASRHHIIGEYDLNEKLSIDLSKLGYILQGRRSDLSAVLRPYDIAIIPYNHSTGMRTKIALYYSYRIAIIAYKNSVLGMEEIEHNKNAILVSNYIEFARELLRLSSSYDLRKKIADNGYITFIERNSMSCSLPKYQIILNAIS